MTKRASGEETSAVVAKAESAELDETTNLTLPDEDAKKWRTPGFQRMRTDWRKEDRMIFDQVKVVVDGRMRREFEEAYRLLFAIHSLVRIPEVTEYGEIKKDEKGLAIWKKDEHGSYIEDYSQLNLKEKERFMFALTTRLVLWQQAAADSWGEAMFAKAMWEERFSIGYDTARGGTIEGNTAKGKLDAREERYFAVMLSWYSRKADGLVSSMQLLAQRLKDSMA